MKTTYLDSKLIAVLATDLGPEDFAFAARQFEQDALASFTQFASAVESGDEILARRTAHRLRGLLLQFGAVPALEGLARFLRASGEARRTIRGELELAVRNAGVEALRVACALGAGGRLSAA